MSAARPFHPPSLSTLQAGADGTLAARIAAEERLRARAHEAGRLAGLEEGLTRGRAEGALVGRAEAERAMQAELVRRGQTGAAAAAQAFEALLAAGEAERHRLDAALRAALAAALETLFPTLLARAMGGEIVALAAEALRLRPEAGITLRAHPATLAAAQAEGLPGAGRLRLLPDETLPPGAAEAAWDQGGLTFAPEQLLARIGALLGAPSTPPALPGDPPQETKR